MFEEVVETELPEIGATCELFERGLHLRRTTRIHLHQSDPFAVDAGGLEARSGGGEKSVFLVVSQRMRPRRRDVIDVPGRALPPFPGGIDCDDDVVLLCEKAIQDVPSKENITERDDHIALKMVERFAQRQQLAGSFTLWVLDKLHLRRLHFVSFVSPDHHDPSNPRGAE